MLKIKGFSLVELLVSLIVISIILSALAPIMTKRLKRGQITVGAGGGKVTTDCEDIDEACKLCYRKKECIACEKTCLVGEFLYTPSCKCKPCDELIENCETCTPKQCTKAKTRLWTGSGRK